MAYPTERPDGGRGLSLQRFDGDRWYEPKPLEMFGSDTASIASYEWSPKGDQLLYTVASSDSRTWVMAVATPRDDGPIATKVLTEEPTGAGWAPTGDRILLRGTVMSVVDVRGGSEVDGSWPSRPIALPAGTVHVPREPMPHSNTLGDGAFSADGRWIHIVLTREDSNVRLMYALSTTGEDAPRAFEACPLGGETADGCSPDGWLPSGATLLARRFENGKASMEAWDPTSGAHSTLGDVEILRSLGRDSSRLLTRDRTSGRISVVDLRDVDAPELIAVPIPEQDSSANISASPDGRWVLSTHRDGGDVSLGLVDLRTQAPWQLREIHLTGVAENSGFSWSPGGRFIFFHHIPATDTGMLLGRIDVESGAQRTFEELPPSRVATDGAPQSWAWWSKIADDDRTAPVDRDGMLAIWRMDEPRETAIVLEGIPSSVIAHWVPAGISQ